MDEVDVTSERMEYGLSMDCLQISRIVESYSNGNSNDTVRFCDDCGAEISPLRLKAIPNATRCTACQSIYDETKGV